MIYAYLRRMPTDPTGDTQRDILLNYPIDFWVEEQSYRANDVLAEMIDQLKSGDKVYVASLLSFAQSLNQLKVLLETFKKRNISLYFVKEGISIDQPLDLTFGDIITLVTDYQSEAIGLKTKEGLDEAKDRGVSTGRPRKKDANVQKAIDLYTSGDYTLKQIKEMTNISKSTLYRYLNEDY